MGGAGGHMAHLHENTWLSFGEIKSFLSQVAAAEISPVEKVDGQNIFFRWTPEGIRLARNGGHLKRGGIDERAFRDMFAGHPAEGAFINGMETIKTALNSLSDAGKNAFLASAPNSFRFVNTEIMYPENENLILYDGNYIVLHNMKEIAIDGKKIRETDVFMSGDPEFDAIVSSLSATEKAKDAAEWRVFGPKFVELNNIASGTALTKVVSDIDTLGYDDQTKLFKMVEDRLVPMLNSAGIPQEKVAMMLQRIKLISEGAETSELPPLRPIKQGLNADQKAVITEIGSVAKAKKFIGEAVAPMAKFISDFAIEVLRGLESFFVGDSETEVNRIRTVLQDSISALERYSGDNAERIGAMLELQLEKLGPIENIASTMEGVIFEYPPGSKNLVKLTGSFAMANQIIGRAKRLPPAAVPAQQDISLDETATIYTADELEMLYESIGMSPPTGQQKSVAVIGGAFKPPHLGHLQMVYHYLDLADTVNIYISNPQSAKSQRSIGNSVITAEMSLALWQILLGNVANVSVEISSAPSPITVAYDSVMPGTTPFPAGTTVYLGASVKGNDVQRFSGAVKKADPSLNVPSPAAYAAPAAELPAEYMQKLQASEFYLEMPSVLKRRDPKDYSASDLRFLLEMAAAPGRDNAAAKNLASYFVGQKNIDAYMSVLGILSETKKYSLRYRIFGD
mgnify:CR=1 FL=1